MFWQNSKSNNKIKIKYLTKEKKMVGILMLIFTFMCIPSLIFLIIKINDYETSR